MAILQTISAARPVRWCRACSQLGTDRDGWFTACNLYLNEGATVNALIAMICYRLKRGYILMQP